MLLITKRWAQVVLILPKKLEPLGTIELGLYEDYFDQQTLETMHDAHSNCNHEYARASQQSQLGIVT